MLVLPFELADCMHHFLTPAQVSLSNLYIPLKALVRFAMVPYHTSVTIWYDRGEKKGVSSSLFQEVST